MADDGPRQIEAWRLVKRAYADDALSGEGARLYGGRFNSVGTAVVYTAESLALAELEVLVHLPIPALLQTYVAFRVRFNETLVEALRPGDLPDGWRRSPVPQAVRDIGDAWTRSGHGLVLKVPSTVVPLEANYLINPNQSEAGRLEVTGPIDPKFDPRLF